MNSEFHSCYNKLKANQTQLERIERNSINFIKFNFDLGIENEFQQLYNTREQEFSKIHSEIHNVVFPMKIVKRQLSTRNLDDIDLPLLKSNMITIEKDINMLKVRIDMELESLANVEHTLFSELVALEIKLQNDDSVVPSNSSTTYPISKLRSDDSLQPEVINFLNFVNNSGGHEGGWSTEDHLLFIKFYNKFKSLKQVVSSLHFILPDKSEAEISCHAAWYTAYLELREKQKDAIAKWRKNKTTAINNEQQVQQTTKTNNMSKKGEVRSETKEKIQQWKLQKQSTREQLKIVQTKKSETAKKSKEKYAKLKVEVETWKNNKRIQENVARLEREIVALKERELQISLANKLIHEFRSLDDVYVNRRRAKALKTSSAGPDVSVSEPGPASGPRDPLRLLRPTRQWLARIAPARDARGAAFGDAGPSVARVAKLAVPDWRKAAT